MLFFERDNFSFKQAEMLAPPVAKFIDPGEELPTSDVTFKTEVVEISLVAATQMYYSYADPERLRGGDVWRYPNPRQPMILRYRYNNHVESIAFYRDAVVMPKGFLSESPSRDFVIEKARQYLYRISTDGLSRATPQDWSEFFFGHIYVEENLPDINLPMTIIELNDGKRMKREEIAATIEAMMGDRVPRIPVNPMSWLLEPTPCIVLKEESSPGAIWSYPYAGHTT